MNAFKVLVGRGDVITRLLLTKQTRDWVKGAAFIGVNDLRMLNSWQFISKDDLTKRGYVVESELKLDDSKYYKNDWRKQYWKNGRVGDVIHAFQFYNYVTGTMLLAVTMLLTVINPPRRFILKLNFTIDGKMVRKQKTYWR